MAATATFLPVTWQPIVGSSKASSIFLWVGVAAAPVLLVGVFVACLLLYRKRQKRKQPAGQKVTEEPEKDVSEISLETIYIEGSDNSSISDENVFENSQLDAALWRYQAINSQQQPYSLTPITTAGNLVSTSTAVNITGIVGQMPQPFTRPVQQFQFAGNASSVTSANNTSSAMNGLITTATTTTSSSNSVPAFYYREAFEKGYVIGGELAEVLRHSTRCNNAASMFNNSGSCLPGGSHSVLKQFMSRYGRVDSSTRSAYMQLGVRVPSKEHVSEIVGKGGSKIKSLREETGALITTPNEQDDHVFIVEAPPVVALRVADYLQHRAEEITLSKSKDRRRMSGPAALGGSHHHHHHRKALAKDKISVPADVVGKIIGTQGSIITTIQRDTGTEIRSPPRAAPPGGSTSSDPAAGNTGTTPPSRATTTTTSGGSVGNADFEIVVFEQYGVDVPTAKGRIHRAKQLIAHLALRQIEGKEQFVGMSPPRATEGSEELPDNNVDEVKSPDNVSNSMQDLSCCDPDNANFPDALTPNCLTHRRSLGGQLDARRLLPGRLGGGTLLRPAASPPSGGVTSSPPSDMVTAKNWNWPDVQPMSITEANEVIERILMQSKTKTRKDSHSGPGNPSSATSPTQQQQSQSAVNTNSTEKGSSTDLWLSSAFSSSTPVKCNVSQQQQLVESAPANVGNMLLFPAERRESDTSTTSSESFLSYFRRRGSAPSGGSVSMSMFRTSLRGDQQDAGHLTSPPLTSPLEEVALFSGIPTMTDGMRPPPVVEEEPSGPAGDEDLFHPGRYFSSDLWSSLQETIDHSSEASFKHQQQHQQDSSSAGQWLESNHLLGLTTATVASLSSVASTGPHKSMINLPPSSTPCPF